MVEWRPVDVQDHAPVADGGVLAPDVSRRDVRGRSLLDKDFSTPRRITLGFDELGLIQWKPL
jgi:hypothetical protein